MIGKWLVESVKRSDTNPIEDTKAASNPTRIQDSDQFFRHHVLSSDFYVAYISTLAAAVLQFVVIHRLWITKIFELERWRFFLFGKEVIFRNQFHSIYRMKRIRDSEFRNHSDTPLLRVRRSFACVVQLKRFFQHYDNDLILYRKRSWSSDVSDSSVYFREPTQMYLP